ncbi:MAG: DUF1499 domain-containing protein [Pseudomonadota bacterium]|nr:DUF1499 domain-containing protein [Pseudomonadota bacterium]
MTDHLQPSWWARFSLVGAIFAAVLLVLAPLAYRLGLAGVQGAVLMLPAMATVLAFLAFLFGLFGFVLWLRGGRPADRLHVLLGSALSLAVLVQMGGQFALARNVPAIHDISTDPVDPPAFVAVVPLRASAPNGFDYDRETLAPLMAEHYADLAPLVIDADPAAVFSRAEAVVAAQGWTLVASDPAGGLIEAYDQTALYGFIDDVVIRIRALGPRQAQVDVRSVSRVGQSDLGANAARIRAFLAALDPKNSR